MVVWNVEGSTEERATQHLKRIEAKVRAEVKKMVGAASVWVLAMIVLNLLFLDGLL